MSISAQDVKDLRDQTGAGMMDCKKALSETGGDFEKALEFLKKQGLAKAEKKSGRIAAEGLIFYQESLSETWLVELNCETDFVAKNEDFLSFGQKLAKLLFDKKPKTLEQALSLDFAESSVETKINELIAKIGEKISLRRFERIGAKNKGQLGSYIHMGGRIIVVAEITGDKISAENIKDVCMQIAAMNPESEISLMQQTFVKDPSGKKTVEQFLKEIDNTARVIQFTRYAVGEGIEKRAEDFADEVAKMMQ